MSQRVTVDLIMEEDLWQGLELSRIAGVACEAAAKVAELPQPSEVSILATNDTKIAELNGQFRNKLEPTNVLSWPAEDLSNGAGQRPRYPDDRELGDIAISYQTCAKEAKVYNKSFEDHVTHLLIHGFLHLLGYDHVQDDDAILMESLEIKGLETLGIDNPY